jgi:C1A family cysteine protease
LSAMSVSRYYGGIPDTKDCKDRIKIYNAQQITSGEDHPRADLRRHIHHVYDQGNLSSCTANAVCAAYALDLNKQRALGGDYEPFDPSRLFLYYNTRERRNKTLENTGASVHDTIKAFKRQGVCSESLWPGDLCDHNQQPIPNGIPVTLRQPQAWA